MERTTINRYDGYEVAPCLTLQDDGRSPSTESYETVEERNAAMQQWCGNGYEEFWTLYGHRTGQGVEAIGDFRSERAALDVLYSITGADLPEIHARTIYQMPERQSSVDLIDPAALAARILKNAANHLYDRITAGTQLDLCPDFKTIQWLEERLANLHGDVMRPADNEVTLRLLRYDAGQILDGLECRAASWRATAEVLESGHNPDDVVMEECSNAREATGIADHYDSIIAAIRAQLPAVSAPSVYYIGDQPMTCPKCGARTDYKELENRRQKHTCLQCGFVFTAEIERS